MLLGLISFFVFLTETSGGALQLGESWLVPFEFAHFLIFFVAIVYTLQAFWLAVMVRGPTSTGPSVDPGLEVVTSQWSTSAQPA